MIRITAISPDLTDAYRTVRLRALRGDPQAFGSTYARESSFTDEQWAGRVARADGDAGVGFLAFEEGAAEACGLVACFKDQDGAAVGHVVSMWVAPSHRRRGVGGALMARAIQWAESQGLKALQLDVSSNNASATRLYERLGFALTGETEPHPNVGDLMLLRMVRRVGG